MNRVLECSSAHPLWASVGKSPLCAPVLSKDGILLSGTQRLDGDNRFLSAPILFPDIAIDLKDDAAAIWTTQAPGQVQDVRWIDSHHFVAAVDSNLVLGQSNGNFSFHDQVSFTQLHSDFIREIDVSPLFSNIVVSAGDDGRAVISDVERLVSSTDFPGSTSIHVYNAHQSVSSLSWSRFSSHVCCLTTDLGHFHAFDSRRKGRACTIGAIDTKENELTSHAILSEFQFLLGHLSGKIHAIDIRYLKTPTFSSVVDVAHDIESMRFHLSSGVLAVFGSQRYVLLLWTPYALVIRCSNSRTPIRLN